MVDPFSAITGALGSCDIILRAAKAITEYVSDVKTAPKDIERIAEEIQSLKAITTALREFLKSDRVKNQGFNASAPIANALAKCKTYISELQQDLDATRQKSRFRWPLEGKLNIEKTLGNLYRYTSLFHWALSVDGWSFFCETSEETTMKLENSLESMKDIIKVLQPVSGMQSNIEDLKGHCEKIESILKVFTESTAEEVSSDVSKTLGIVQGIDARLQSEVNAKDRKELLEWISTFDFLQRHRDVILTRQEGTGLWVSDTAEYIEWFGQEDTGVLWCHGIPGCGKTVIFSAIVDDLMEPETHLVGAMYFDYKKAADYGVQTIFLGILRQFYDKSYHLVQVKRAIDELNGLCSKQNKRKPSLAECLEMLRMISGFYDATFLCFDALDELPDLYRVGLMKSLRDLCQDSKIKVLLTSRDHIELKPQPNSLVKCPVLASDPDLRKYLGAKILGAESACLYEKASKSRVLREEIISKISARAKGMFLLAELQMKQLEAALTEREIRGLLQSLPGSIDDQYRSYVERIGSGRQGPLALRALMWVFGSYRPFSREELLEALSIQDNDTDLDDTGITTIERIISITGGLLIFEKESNTVRLVHETLQHFFHQMNRQEIRILPECHLMISRSISTYLNFEAFNISLDNFSSTDWMTLGALQRSHKFLRYAFLHWNHHVDNARVLGTSLGVDVATRISSSPVLLSMASERGLLRLPLLRADGFLALHTAVLWNSAAIVERCLALESGHEHHSSINHRSDAGLTALHLAAINNNIDIAKTLAQQGANIEAVDQKNRTPLYLAASCSSSDVLGYLIDLCKSRSLHTISIMAKDLLSPLQAALRNGNVDCARQLLSAGADVAHKTDSGQTALHYAVQYAPTATQLLLDHGASTEETSKNGRNSLHWACVGGDKNCIRLLLDQGTDPNARSRDGEMPLHLLAKAGIHLLDTAKHLLCIGAAIDDKDNGGLTPLHNAIMSKNFEVAVHLISKGANVHASTNDGRIPLHFAATHEDTPSSLWKLLSDVNSKDNNGETSLHIMARKQKATEVENLIGNGAEIDLTNQDGETALHLAVQNYSARRRSTHRGARSDAVSLLLQHGASVNTRSKAGLTAIHLALRLQSIPLLRMLMRFKSNAEYKFPDGESFIHFAISKGSVQLLQYLVDIEADVNESCFGLSPLHFAVECLVVVAKSITSSQPPITSPLSLTLRKLSSSENLRYAAKREHEAMHVGQPYDEVELRKQFEHIVQACEKIKILIAQGADSSSTDWKNETSYVVLERWSSENRFVPGIWAAAVREVLQLIRGHQPREASQKPRAEFSEDDWDDDIPIYIPSEDKRYQVSRPRRDTAAERRCRQSDRRLREEELYQIRIRRLTAEPSWRERKLYESGNRPMHEQARRRRVSFQLPGDGDFERSEVRRRDSSSSADDEEDSKEWDSHETHRSTDLGSIQE